MVRQGAGLLSGYNDEVYFSGKGILYHFVKAVTALNTGASDTFIYLDYENDTRIYGPRPPKNPIK